LAYLWGASLKALITGIAGFAGSHLADYLVANTELQIFGIVRSRDNNIAHLRDRLTLSRGDLCDGDWVIGVLKETEPDYIFHLAAQAFVPLAWRAPWDTLENNIRGELNLLEGIITLGMAPRILVVGSGDEYGLVYPDELPVRETNPLRPYNPYGVSKIAQDLLGYQYFASHELPIVRVRPFNHFGPRQEPSFVAAAFAKQIAEAEEGLRGPDIMVGNLEARRDFTDVRDIVRGYHLALLYGEPGEVYNLGSEKAYAIGELLEVLLGMSALPLEVKPDPERMRPSDVSVLVSDCSKFRAQTGWEAAISFEEGLKALLDHWRRKVHQPSRSPAIR